MSVPTKRIQKKGRVRSNDIHCRISSEAWQYLDEFKKLTGLPTGQVIELWALVVSNVDPDDVIRLWGQKLSAQSTRESSGESHKRYLARVEESKTMSNYIKEKAVRTIKLLAEDYLLDTPYPSRLTLKSKLLNSIPSHYSPSYKEIWRKEIEAYLSSRFPDRNNNDAAEIATPSLFADDMF